MLNVNLVDFMLINEKERIDYLFQKAKDFYTLNEIVSTYSELSEFKESNLSNTIYEIYREIFSYPNIVEHESYMEICFCYVKQSLLLKFEETNDQQLLLHGIDKLKEVEEICYDINFIRNIDFLFAKIYFHLGEYEKAEKYISNVYNDYDFSTDTFILYMAILDALNKFIDMIDISIQYCSQYAELHKKINYYDLYIRNIKKSKYNNDFKNIFGGCNENQL